MIDVSNPASWLASSMGRVSSSNLREWLEEPLAPGDVTSTGCLLQCDGSYLMTGCALISSAQADAAAYYGWTRSGLQLIVNGFLRTQVFRMALDV